MLFQKITDDMKSAMKAKDSVRVSAIRSLFAAIKSAAIDSGDRETISDELAIQVVKKQAKQRKDSIQQFQDANRDDLAAVEIAELNILEEYLPEMMSEEAVEKIVREVQEATGVTDPSKMGMLMGAVMKKLQGQDVDGTLVRKVVMKVLG